MLLNLFAIRWYKNRLSRLQIHWYEFIAWTRLHRNVLIGNIDVNWLPLHAVFFASLCIIGRLVEWMFQAKFVSYFIFYLNWWTAFIFDRFHEKRSWFFGYCECGCWLSWSSWIRLFVWFSNIRSEKSLCYMVKKIMCTLFCVLGRVINKRFDCRSFQYYWCWHSRYNHSTVQLFVFDWCVGGRVWSMPRLLVFAGAGAFGRFVWYRAHQLELRIDAHVPKCWCHFGATVGRLYERLERWLWDLLLLYGRLHDAGQCADIGVDHAEFVSGQQRWRWCNKWRCRRRMCLDFCARSGETFVLDGLGKLCPVRASIYVTVDCLELMWWKFTKWRGLPHATFW